MTIALPPMELFFALVIAHFICDYPLQGDFLAKAKNHKAPLPGVPWQQALLAHSSIHAGAVWLLTGFWSLAFCELCFHAFIDYQKSEGRVGFNTDQTAHIFWKAIYVALIVYAPGWLVSAP